MKTLDFRRLAVALIYVALVTAAGGAIANTLALTGDLDSDFPAQYIREGSSLSPNPVRITDSPLGKTRTDGTPIIITGSNVPSGFHVQRVGVYFDCKSDTIYVGYDVSNPTTDPGGSQVNSAGIPVPNGDPTAVMSRAWDADGDGNPCVIANPMLVSTTISGAGQGGNDDIPNHQTQSLQEKYLVYMDFDRDGTYDATLQVFDNGQAADDDTGNPNGLPTHKHFGNPCAQNPTVHATLGSWTGTNYIINPANSPSIIVDVKYVNSSDPTYPNHRDIEFSIKGVHNLSLSSGPNAKANPYCDLALKSFADSDYDASDETEAVWGDFNFVAAANLQIQCQKTVDKPKLCKLPDTVTYTLTAKNNSATATADIAIIDADFAGSPWIFRNVPAGQSRTVGDGLDQAGTITPPTKLFTTAFCGSAPFVNTMMVSAVPTDCCATGTVTASCQTTVAPPDTGNVNVTCAKSVDKPKLCTLPDTVTYTLSAGNASITNTPVTLIINDPQITGGPWVFTGVAKGATRFVGDGLDQAHTTVKPTKLFTTAFCGSNPFVNTMTVTATAEGCACGTLTAVSTCSASVGPPDTARVKVSCTKSVDKPKLCTLPSTVTYTLTAKSDASSGVPVTLIVGDNKLSGGPWIFQHVAPGDSRTVGDGLDQAATKVKPTQVFGTDFCGKDPFTNTMTVTATAEGCACGTTSAVSTCTAVVAPPDIVVIRVNCLKQANKTQLCSLPDTVTYTLQGTNNGNGPATLIISDPSLVGSPWIFAGVAAGQSRTVGDGQDNAHTTSAPTKLFDTSFCGQQPFINTMTVSATAEGCVCGTTTAIATCTASVGMPPSAKVKVTCNKSVDKPKLCTLPDTVTYTLTGGNSSDTSTTVTLVISDSQLTGGPWIFQHVPQGATRFVGDGLDNAHTTVKPTRLFTTAFCGSTPFVNTMTVSATAEGCACGTTSALATCSASVAPPDTAKVKASCTKQVDKVKLCTLPDTVTYTLTGMNTSDTNTNVTLIINDSQLTGGPWIFKNVPQGATRFVGDGKDQAVTTTKPTKLFTAAFCGSTPFVNTMTVTATAEGCACGTLTATSSCSASVAPPDQVKVHVSCSKVMDKTSLCALPGTVHYTLTALNDSLTDTTCTLTIIDAALNVNRIFPGIVRGQSAVVEIDKTFDTTFCGSAPFVNTMTVSASAEGGCICGTVTATQTCTATLTLPTTSSLVCAVTLNGNSGTQTFLKSDLPQPLNYVFQVCNVGNSKLDCVVSLSDLPPGLTFDQTAQGDGNYHFTVTAGNCFAINGTGTLTPDVVPCPGQVSWNPTMTILSADPSDGECACAPPSLPVCDLPLIVRCPGLGQVYPASSLGKDRSFMGYKGLGGDVINTAPGIFNIIPGEKWVNFIKAAKDKWAGGWTLKNVVLQKKTPQFIQCSEVYAPKTVTQQGTINIRTWWPLMYEAPGTTFTLSVLYGTGQIRVGPNPTDVVNYDDDGSGPNPPSPVHLDTWNWTVEVDLSTLNRLLDLFHELPFGLDEVPLISDEVLYPVLKDKLTTIQALVNSGDMTAASLALGDFELEVSDACISSSPVLPYPTANGTGIAQTNENPACCKILIDVEYIAKKLGIFINRK